MGKSVNKLLFLVGIISIILIAGLALGSCRSTPPASTPTVSSTSPLPTILPTNADVASTPTQVNITELPAVQEPVATAVDSAESTPLPTDAFTATPWPTETPGPTETPAPPVVVTPEAPQFPMTGVEIITFSDIEQAAQAGAYWVRRNALIWSVVEPAEGSRDWGSVASLEAELVSISEHGMQTILIVRGTPSWAQKQLGIHCGPMRRGKMEAFAAFMSDAVARYSQPPFNVKYWELGNEPDVDPALVTSASQYGCWGDPEDKYYGGGFYAQMLKEVYPAIKKADPQAQVLVGGLLLTCDPDNPPDVRGQPGVKLDCSPAKFFEGILRNGGGKYFDGVSFHAYDYYFDVLGKYGNNNWYSSWKTTGPVVIAKATYLRNLLIKYGYPDKYLMNTEVAALCGITGNEAPCWEEDWVNTKTYHLVEAYTAAATVKLRANIWFCLTGWRGSGLVDAYRQPVPAFQALTFNDTMLRGATPWGELTTYQGVKGFAFQNQDKILWVLWSLDGQEHTISLGSLPSAIYNVLGESITPTLDITITLSPVYIEW